MICRTCEEREAHQGKHDCDRCLPILKRLDSYTPDLVRGMARTELFPSRPSDAEAFAKLVDLDWHFTEIADAIRKRAPLFTRGEPFLLRLSGVGLLVDEQLGYLGDDLGAVVTRGTEPDTLYIAGL